MCSIDETALQLVAEAIDKLEADHRSGATSVLEEQVAAVWAMVRDIDPELARRASRYAQPPDHDHVPLGVISGARRHASMRAAYAWPC